MPESSSDVLIRRVLLRQELKPLPILSGDPPQELNPLWAGIVETREAPPQYVLAFFDRAGNALTHLPFASLQMAVEQACAIVGIQPNEWEECWVPSE